MEIIQAGISSQDLCPVLTRIKPFIVDQGIPAILEHQFRDRRGVIADIRDYFPENSSSLDDHTVFAVVREWVGSGMATDQNVNNWKLVGTPIDPLHGKVRVPLNATVVADAGIYEINFVIADADANPVRLDRALLSVERSLFGNGLTSGGVQGPPTLNELRMLMGDTAAENVLIREAEFSDEELLLAITYPIHFWNSMPPDLGMLTTRTFPWRDAWVNGILAKLHEMAAAHYRRNTLVSSGGGLSISDKNREQEYLREAMRLKTQYESWVRMKKMQINLHSYWGSILSY